MIKNMSSLWSFVLCGAALVGAQDPAAAGGGGGGEGRPLETISIQAPTMTEEDQYGFNIPDQYRCNACRASVWHLNRSLEIKFGNRKEKVKTYEIIDEVENVCQAASFEGYGVTMRDGQNVLTGPAIEALTPKEPEKKRRSQYDDVE